MSKHNPRLDHFRIRAWERVGEHLSKKACHQITKDIQNGRAELLGKLNFTIAVWRVQVHGKPMIIVYDGALKEPVTVLTEQLWQERKVYNSPKVNDTSPLRAVDPKMVAELSKLKE